MYILWLVSCSFLLSRKLSSNCLHKQLFEIGSGWELYRNLLKFGLEEAWTRWNLSLWTKTFHTLLDSFFYKPGSGCQFEEGQGSCGWYNAYSKGIEWQTGQPTDGEPVNDHTTSTSQGKFTNANRFSRICSVVFVNFLFNFILWREGVNTQYQPLPLQVPNYTPGWREVIIIKYLAQGHMCQDRDSNPHSDHLNLMR